MFIWLYIQGQPSLFMVEQSWLSYLFFGAFLPYKYQSLIWEFFVVHMAMDGPWILGGCEDIAPKEITDKGLTVSTATGQD